MPPLRHFSDAPVAPELILHADGGPRIYRALEREVPVPTRASTMTHQQLVVQTRRFLAVLGIVMACEALPALHGSRVALLALGAGLYGLGWLTHRLSILRHAKS